MNQNQLNEILENHKKWLETRGSNVVENCRADMRYAELCYADLRHADLRHADLRHADLRHAELHDADLRYAELHHADLREANLRYADLHNANIYQSKMCHADLHNANIYQSKMCHADLRDANMYQANLRYADMIDADMRRADMLGADLRDADMLGVNIDFSCWPLWCGGLHVHIDDRQAVQLLYHLLSCALYSRNTSAELKSVLSAPELVETANKFHRVNECGRICAEKESAPSTAATVQGAKEKNITFSIDKNTRAVKPGGAK